MTIRYQCDECGSVLKIKDALAGTRGKCPKCKQKFTVPEVGEGHVSPTADEADALVDSKIEKNSAAPAAARAEKGTNGVRPASADGDDFDVDAFLMDDKAPGAKASAGLSSAPTAAATPRPTVDSQGRRMIAPPPPSPGSSAEFSTRDSANTAVNASANARELLTKTTEDGRARAAAAAGAKKPFIKYDIAGSLKQLRSQAVYVVIGIVAVVGVYFLADRMLSSRLPLPVLAPVSGTVRINGEALPNVIVHLTPVNVVDGQSTDGKPIRLRDSTGVTDANGYFEIQYMEGVPGAPLGKSRVWIEAVNPSDFKKIPGPYQSNSSADIRDVKEVGNESRFTLDLKSP